MQRCEHCGAPIYKVDLVIKGSFLHHTKRPELVAPLPRRFVLIMEILLGERLATRDSLLYAMWTSRGVEEPEYALRTIYVYLHRLRVILKRFDYTIKDYQIVPL